MTLGVRSIEPGDRDRLLTWRNSPRVRAVSTNDRELTEAEHYPWFERMLEQRREELLIVESDGRPVGVVQLEQLDLDQATSSWGVHLGETDVHPAIGATLPVIGLSLGFGRFNLRRMNAVVLSSNKNMVSMHRRLGIEREGVRREMMKRADGSIVDVHEYGVLRDEWRAVVERSSKLLPNAIRSGLAEVVDKLAPSSSVT